MLKKPTNLHIGNNNYIKKGGIRNISSKDLILTKESNNISNNPAGTNYYGSLRSFLTIFPILTKNIDKTIYSKTKISFDFNNVAAINISNDKLKKMKTDKRK